MKILLVGEYSGFFTNLKFGLEELGIDCVLASNKDGWKNISSSDIPLYNQEYSNRIQQLYNLIIEPYLHKNKLYGYDIVQFVNPSIYSTHINSMMFDSIKKNSGKCFVSIAGDCLPVYEAYKQGMLKYYIYDDNEQLSNKYVLNTNYAKAFRKQEIHVLENCDGIIPIMYEYAIGVKKYKHCKKTIPIPFSTRNVEYEPNVVKNGKLVIAHGIIREKSKGSDYIIKALNYIKEKYPNSVEILIDGKMPLNEYLIWLKKANVLVDQCKEHCYGMNALYAMAEGRVVLGGASAESLQEFGFDTSPVRHITPNVEQIVKQIEILLENRKEFERLGYESRKFVEEKHDCKIIAQQYINTWKEG